MSPTLDAGDLPVYRLTIVDSSGSSYDVAGPRAGLEEVIDEAKNPATEWIDVTGCYDGADRCEKRVVLKREEVRGFSLVRLA